MLPRHVLFVHVFVLFATGLAAHSGRFREVSGRYANVNARQDAASGTTASSGTTSTDPCASGLSTSRSSSSSGFLSTGSSSLSSIGNCSRSSFTSTSYTYSNGSSTGKNLPTGSTGGTTSLTTSSSTRSSGTSSSSSNSQPYPDGTASGSTGTSSTSRTSSSSVSSSLNKSMTASSGQNVTLSASSTASQTSTTSAITTSSGTSFTSRTSSSSVSSSSNESTTASPGQTLTLSASSTASQASTTSAITTSSGTSLVPFLLAIVGTNSLGSTVTTSVPISTTITSPPSSYETVSATNSKWSSNTVTTSDGIIFPVLVGCGKPCGSCAGCGLILKGLGGLTSDPPRPGCGGGIIGLFRSVFGCGTAFNLPGLGGISFALGLSGTPEPDGGKNTDDDDDNKRQSTSDDDNKSQTTNGPSSASASTPSSSSLTTSSSSSSSSSSGSSASGISTQYIIWPTEGANMAGISSSLSSQIGTDNFATISIESTSTIFVAVFPTASILAQWQNDPNVAVELDVETPISGDGDAYDSSPNCVTTPSSQASAQRARREVRRGQYDPWGTESSPVKRAGYIWSEPAVPELRFISQPRGVQVWNIGTYTYDTTAGQGISVYVVDTGANMQNPEISGMVGGVAWLLPKENFWKRILGKTMSQTDEANHGTCVASKVAGLKWGVAKRARVVVVKMNYEQVYKFSDVLRSLELIIKDVNQRARNEGHGKSVVNLSFGGPLSDERQIAAEQKLLQILLDLDVIVVISAGNDKGQLGRSDQVDSHPALHRRVLTNIIVVGSVTVDGARTLYSQGGPFVDIYAPGSVADGLEYGYGIECASGSTDGSVRKEGTSFAAPAVAGLAAYFMSIVAGLKSDPRNPGLLPQKVKAYITNPNLAFGRYGGDLAISNGLSSPLLNPRMMHRDLEARDNTGPPACIAQSGSSEPYTPPLPPPGSGSSANTSSTVIADATSSAPSSTLITDSILNTASTRTTAPVSTTTGMLDGAPWLDPDLFCHFGSLTYPTISLPSTITDSAKLCAYTTLNSSSAITPKQTSAIPTNRPGYGGIPGCVGVVFGPAHQDCPYGTDGWCNCGGVIVPPLAPTVSGFINCDITIQPTASSCPVNTARSLAVASASSAAAASRSAAFANAKATPNTVVSSFACPTNAVSGGPGGFGPGLSNQETASDAKGRKALWANINPWGCDMPSSSDRDAAANEICGGIPPNTVLSLGTGNQPFYRNSTNKNADDHDCGVPYYNMGFTVKDKCQVNLTKDYCLGMYDNIKRSCPTLDRKKKAITWEGGLVTDNCGIAYFTSGEDVATTDPTYEPDPFYHMTNTYWWDTNHLTCGPDGFQDPLYCPKPLPH